MPARTKGEADEGRTREKKSKRIVLLVSVDAVRGIGFRVTVCHPGSLTDMIGRPAPNIEIISSTNKKLPDRFDFFPT